MNNENNNLEFLDILTIMSFGISISNLEENRKQSNDISKILNEIQEHLHRQDEILERQCKMLERGKHEN